MHVVSWKIRNFWSVHFHMLTGRKSDPYYLTATPNTRNRRRLRKQKTTLSRLTSGSESTSQGNSIYQMLMNTKSAVQGIGYNFRSYLFDDSRPIEFESGSNERIWLVGVLAADSCTFYRMWKHIHRMTYRKRWPDPILNRKIGVLYDSDTGWGCTIRSCQMLLAHVLCRLGYEEDKLISFFLDRASALFSIQNFIQSQSQIQAGEWFGPTSASQVLKTLLETEECKQSLHLGMVLSVDGRICIQDILTQSSMEENSISSLSSSASPGLRHLVEESADLVGSGRANSWELCNTDPVLAGSCLDQSLGPEEEFWMIDGESEESFSPDQTTVTTGMWNRPVLVLVAMRLSPEAEMSQSQISALLGYMTIPSFAGFLGGPDRRCHYIVGLIEEAVAENFFDYTLLSVDPHIVQDAAVSSACPSIFANSSHPSRVSPSYLCPSIAIGFLLRSQAELDQLGPALPPVSPGGAFMELTSVL